MDDEKWWKTIDERPPVENTDLPLELISFHARFANLLSNDKWKNVGPEIG